MPEIHVLPKEVYELIAAGEVVERPSSVVKEMIENSIDAKASNITVEIKNGGLTYIRITDDGCGIDKSQVKKVFVSHATSKISNKDDLDAIGTLGFRGEAMASIAAVSKVELLSREVDKDTGVRYAIQAGEEVDFSEAGCPQGTTIVVRDIFYNVPARMKFLKKDVTEGNSVAAIVDRMAISHKDISFRFIRDGKQVMMTPGNGDLHDTIYSVLGKDFAKNLLEVKYDYNGMHIEGYVTSPHDSRKSRAMQYFFINDRTVKSQTMMAALEQAYRNTIMVGRFPGCVLNMTCDTSFVDVNVHPAKIEVRFANEKPVFDLVYYGVKSAIEEKDTYKEAELPNQFINKTTGGYNDPFAKPSSQATQISLSENPYRNKDFWQDAGNKSQENTKSGFIPTMSPTSKTAEVKDVRQDSNPVSSYAEDLKVVPENQTHNDIEEIPNFKVVGEAFKTYIIVEIDKELYIVDKHAAHERMNFEKLKSETKISSQVLIEPVSVKLSKDEYSCVCDNLELYSKCGFLVEDFGNSSVIVRECPSMLNFNDVDDLIHETAQKLLEGQTNITPDQMEWIFDSTSCRAAVKAGDFTSEFEREKFVKKLLSMPNIKYCPHGRPVLVKLTQYQIEKMFGRIQ